MLGKEGRLKGLFLLLMMLGATLTSVVSGVKPAAADPVAISFGSAWAKTPINACSMTGTWTGVDCGGQAPVGQAWQCVELVQRAYQLAGWHTGAFPNVPDYAFQIWSAAAGMGMTTYTNGASNLNIVPGDMIVHDHASEDPIGYNNAGHVNIVDSVTNTTITVVEQNWGNPGAAHVGTYTLSNHILSRSDIPNVKDPAGHVMPILGVVHSPNNHNTNAAISGDYNHDGYSDLHKVVFTGTGSGNIENHILTGTNFASFLGHLTTAWTAPAARDGYYLLGDYNHDSNQDLYHIYLNPTGAIEVHILAGPSFTTSLGDWVTPAGPTSTSQVEVALGDYNADGYPDLYLVYLNGTGSGQVEVHILDGTNFQNWLGHWVTPASTTSTNDEEIALSDYNHDGKPDLYIMPTDPASGHMEVHILDGGGFNAWLGHWVTPAGSAKASYERLLIGDYNHDGYGDIYLVVYDNGASPSTTDVHILNGTNFNSWLGHWATASGGTPSTRSELLLG